MKKMTVEEMKEKMEKMELELKMERLNKEIEKERTEVQRMKMKVQRDELGFKKEKQGKRGFNSTDIWSRFGTGFILRIISPITLGFVILMYKTGGTEVALGFMGFVGILGGLKMLRRTK